MIELSNEALILIFLTLIVIYPTLLLLVASFFSRRERERTVKREVRQDYERQLKKLSRLLKAELTERLDQFLSEFLAELAEHLSQQVDIEADVDRQRRRIEAETQKYAANLKKLEEKLTADWQKSEERSRQTLEVLIDEAQKRFNQQFEEELAAARRAIKNYQETRMRKIERKLTALVEDVAYRALKKRLSFSDQTELIYKALEEAKQEGFFEDR